jgi:hypothetical protein
MPFEEIEGRRSKGDVASGRDEVVGMGGSGRMCRYSAFGIQLEAYSVRRNRRCGFGVWLALAPGG